MQTCLRGWAQCCWIQNIKQLIWMKARVTGFASLHVFIKSALQKNESCGVQAKYTLSSVGEKLTVKSPPAWGKNEHFKMCYTSKAFRAYSSISVILMLWNISSASLLALCKTRRGLSLLNNEPWSLLDQSTLNWKGPIPFSFLLVMAVAWVLIRKTQSHIITLDETKEDNPVDSLRYVEVELNYIWFLMVPKHSFQECLKFL